MMSSDHQFDLTRFLPYQLSALASKTSREFSEIYARRFGLSIPEWRVLAHLAQVQNVSVRDIHSRVDMDKPKVSRAAARLELRGFVSKKTHETDKRLVVLTLTAKGRRTISEIAPLADQFGKELIDGLEPGERDVFLSVLEKLNNSRPTRIAKPKDIT